MDMSGMDMGSMASATSSMSMDMASMASSISSTMASMASATASMSMDMASMSSAMASMSMDMAASATGSMAAAATSTAMSMGGMDHGGMHMGGSCKISMMWNWNTIDACFISKDWHVTSRGMFAGTCIGVFAWILALEALRRAHREFDQYVARTSTVECMTDSLAGSKTNKISLIKRSLPPNLWQQAVRSLLYTVEFGASYLLMLMAMYYNGYILITMWISAFISYFLFATDTVGTKQPKTCC